MTKEEIIKVMKKNYYSYNFVQKLTEDEKDEVINLSNIYYDKKYNRITNKR